MKKKNSSIIQIFLKEQRSRNNSEKTIKYYEQALKQFQLFYAGDLIDVRSEDIIDFILYLRSDHRLSSHPYKDLPRKLSPSTIRTYINALRGFYSWLYKSGYIAYDVFRSIQMPKKPQSLVKILTDKEIQRLLWCVGSSPRNELLVLLMLDCGLRASECINLKIWDYVPGEHPFLRVTGKGNKERIVPVSPYTQNKLESYARTHPGASVLDMSYNAVKCVFQRLKKSASIPQLHPHLLRHTFATKYILNGGDSLKLKYILGHSTMDMVDHYVHLATSLQIASATNYSPFSIKK